MKVSDITFNFLNKFKLTRRNSFLNLNDYVHSLSMNKYNSTCRCFLSSKQMLLQKPRKIKSKFNSSARFQTDELFRRRQQTRAAIINATKRESSSNLIFRSVVSKWSNCKFEVRYLPRKKTRRKSKIPAVRILAMLGNKLIIEGLFS